MIFPRPLQHAVTILVAVCSASPSSVEELQSVSYLIFSLLSLHNTSTNYLLLLRSPLCCAGSRNLAASLGSSNQFLPSWSSSSSRPRGRKYSNEFLIWKSSGSPLTTSASSAAYSSLLLLIHVSFVFCLLHFLLSLLSTVYFLFISTSFFIFFLPSFLFSFISLLLFIFLSLLPSFFCSSCLLLL